MPKKNLFLFIILGSCFCVGSCHLESENLDKNNNELRKQLSVFCVEMINLFHMHEDPFEITLSYSVDGEYPEIIVDGIVDNEDEATIVYLFVSGFLHDDPELKDENIKIIWNASFRPEND